MKYLLSMFFVFIFLFSAHNSFAQQIGQSCNLADRSPSGALICCNQNTSKMGDKGVWKEKSDCRMRRTSQSAGLFDLFSSFVQSVVEAVMPSAPTPSQPEQTFTPPTAYITYHPIEPIALTHAIISGYPIPNMSTEQPGTHLECVPNAPTTGGRNTSIGAGNANVGACAPRNYCTEGDLQVYDACAKKIADKYQAVRDDIAVRLHDAGQLIQQEWARDMVISKDPDLNGVIQKCISKTTGSIDVCFGTATNLAISSDMSKYLAIYAEWIRDDSLTKQNDEITVRCGDPTNKTCTQWTFGCPNPPPCSTDPNTGEIICAD